MADQFPPEIAHLIDLLAQLTACNDRRFITEDLTALLEDRVRWVLEKQDADLQQIKGKAIPADLERRKSQRK